MIEELFKKSTDAAREMSEQVVSLDILLDRGLQRKISQMRSDPSSL